MIVITLVKSTIFILNITASVISTCVQIISRGLTLAFNQVQWREVVLQWLNSQAFCKSVLTGVCAPSQLNHIKFSQNHKIKDIKTHSDWFHYCKIVNTNIALFRIACTDKLCTQQETRFNKLIRFWLHVVLIFFQDSIKQINENSWW